MQVQNDLVDLSKHYIHEIHPLVSLDRAECFAIKKKTRKKKLHRHARKSLVYEVSVSVGFIHARAVDLFVYGHSLLHSYMPDDMVSSIEHYSALPTKS